MALSDVAIKALKAKEKRYSVTDSAGLSTEVYPSGVKAWRYRYRLNGKLEKVAFGKYPVISLRDARAMRDEMATKVAKGSSPATAKRKARAACSDSMSMRDFGEKYFREVAIKHRKNPISIRRYLTNQLYPAFGDKPVRDITTEDVRALIWRKKENGRDAAAGDLRGLIKRMFDYAQTCGIVNANPVHALPMRHVFKARSRQRVLQPHEIKLFLRACFESNLRRQFKVAFYLILLTMVRKGELMQARWEHVFLDDGEWHIPPQNSKSGQPHIVYLSRQAKEMFCELHKLAAGSEWVLPGRSSLLRPFDLTSLNVALKKVLHGLDVPAFTIHDFRRTASTLLHEQGWPSDVVEKALNHTIRGVRGVYNRAEYAEQRRQMLQQWGDWLESIVAENAILFGRFKRVA